MWIEKIELEVKRVEELEGATRTLYDDEYSSKRTMGGVNAAREHSQATQIHIHILEKRVYKVYVNKRFYMLIHLLLYSTLCFYIEKCFVLVILILID